jgi:hypothetical protein
VADLEKMSLNICIFGIIEAMFENKLKGTSKNATCEELPSG